MQARVCVQNFDNGDVQGYLYIDDDTGESLVTTSERYAAGTSNATEFTMSGVKGAVVANVRINVPSSDVSFNVNFEESGVPTSSQFSRALEISTAPCV